MVAQSDPGLLRRLRVRLGRTDQQSPSPLLSDLGYLHGLYARPFFGLANLDRNCLWTYHRWLRSATAFARSPEGQASSPPSNAPIFDLRGPDEFVSPSFCLALFDRCSGFTTIHRSLYYSPIKEGRGRKTGFLNAPKKGIIAIIALDS